MTEIIKEVNIIRESKPEDQITDQQLANEIGKNLGIDVKIVQNAVLLSNEIAEREILLGKQSIPMLLIKQLAGFGFLIPIAKSLNQNFATIDDYKTFFNLSRERKKTAKVMFGSLEGKNKKSKKTKEAPPEKKQFYSIGVYFDSPQEVVLLEFLNKYEKGARFKNIVSSDKVEICGFIVKGHNIYNKYNNQEIANTVVRNIVSGNYNLDTVQNFIFKPIEINEAKIFESNVYLFTDEKDMMQKCNELADFIIKSIRDCASINYAFIHNMLYNYSAKHSIYENLFKHLQKIRMNELFISEAKMPKSELPDEILSFVKLVGKIMPISTTFDSSVWHKILTKFRGNISAIMSKNEKKIEEMINKIKNEQELMEKNIKEQQKADKERLIELTNRWFYIEKFGMSKYEKLKLGNSDLILDQVDVRVKRLIENAVAKWKIMTEEIQKKHPWNRLVWIIANGSVQEKEDAFIQLKKYLPPRKQTTDWIRSNDNVPIICPHVVSIFENPDADIITKFSGEAPIYGAYFCKICGEKIGKISKMEDNISFVGDQPVTIHNVDDELKDQIKKTVKMSAGRVVSFKQPQKWDWFINQIVSKIYDPLKVYEKNMGKNRTLSSAELSNRFTLITVIYCYAYLIKLTQDNPKFLNFKLAPGKPQNAKEMINFAIEELKISMNVYINRIPGIDDKYIYDVFMQIYRNILQLYGIKHFIKEEEEPDPIQQIILHPAWNFIKYNAKLAAKDKKEQTVAQILNAPKNVQNIMFDNIHNNFKKGTDNFYYLNFLIDYSKEKIFKMSPVLMSVDKESIGKAISGEITIIKNPKYVKFLEKNANLFKSEIEKISSMLKFYTRNYHALRENITTRYPGFTEQDFKYLSLSHGEDGKHEHQWTKFLYMDGPKKIELTLSQIKKGEKLGRELFLIDIICEICGKSREIALAESDKIHEKLGEQEAMKNFYNLMTFACPIPAKNQVETGDFFHKFDKKQVCENCGFTLKYAETLDPKYYKKYQHADILNPQRVKITPPKPKPKASHQKLNSWIFNASIIDIFIKQTFEMVSESSLSDLSMAKTIKLNQKNYFNFLNNLGLMEQKRIDFIIKGNINPHKDMIKSIDLCKERFSRLHLYIQNSLIIIDSIANYRDVSIPDIELKLIFDKGKPEDSQKVYKLNTGAVMSKLFEVNYYSAINYIREKFADNTLESWISISNFVYEYLLKLIIEFSIELRKADVSVSNELVLLIIKSIIECEKITAKLPENKESNISAEQKHSIDFDPNMIDNRQSREYDDIVDPDQVDKFSYDDMDYDGHNDGWD